MVSFPYYSHTTPIRIPKDMGIVWEAYHKGVPCPWGSLKITLENGESREMEETMDTTRVGLYDRHIWSYDNPYTWPKTNGYIQWLFLVPLKGGR